MAAPAARRVGGGAPSEGVVEEAEEGDAQQVGQPLPQPRRQQVEVGAVVEDRQRRQRDQRHHRQDRPEREGELGAAVVGADEAGVAQPPRPGGQHRDRQRDRQREPDPVPGHGLAALLVTFARK